MDILKQINTYEITIVSKDMSSLCDIFFFIKESVTFAHNGAN